ncbi:uncharacterized protein BDV17DRAFT_150132 [Aspergillus undulatus]|uniref:uncharacterized protein n=1 Tax=Aspergillus undulatus TaxID=1810928 RepID=UPI003CCD361B
MGLGSGVLSEAPKLEEIGEYGLDLSATYQDLAEVNLPSLARVGGALFFTGHIRRINFGNLEETSGAIYLAADSPVEINTSLRSVWSLDLLGQLQALNFHNLSSVEHFSIKSTMPSQCSPALIHLYRAHQREPDFCDATSLALADEDLTHDFHTPAGVSTPLPSHTPTHTWTPSSTPSPSPSPALTPCSGSGGYTGLPSVVVLECFLLASMIFVALRIWRQRMTRNGGRHGDSDDSERNDLSPDISGEKQSLLPQEKCNDAPPPYYSH